MPAAARLLPALAWGLAVLATGLLPQAARAQDVDATQMVHGGLQVVQMIDQGRAGELWDGASAGARKRVTREAFVQQVAQARAPLGAAKARTWVAVTRQALAGDDAEIAGQYVNVEHETSFANRPQQTVRELSTFHLGRDGVWRFSGYFIR